MDEVSMPIAAPPEQLYDLITDVTQMGRWSPECTGGKWLGGATGPATGARFRGSNKHGVMRWWTHCTVTKADRPSAFEFTVLESGMRWGYRFEPDLNDASSTVVTEYRAPAKKTPAVIKAVVKSGIIGRSREEMLVDGMRQSLERLKVAAEAS
jgi:uncharacterized protein YndB with AHSA1/START domain